MSAGRWGANSPPSASLPNLHQGAYSHSTRKSNGQYIPSDCHLHSTCKSDGQYFHIRRASRMGNIFLVDVKLGWARYFPFDVQVAWATNSNLTWKTNGEYIPIRRASRMGYIFSLRRASHMGNIFQFGVEVECAVYPHSTCKSNGPYIPLGVQIEWVI